MKLGGECGVGVYLGVGGVGEDGLRSEFEQNTLYLCIKFLNNKIKVL